MMIPPRDQWCIHVEVTNACGRRCSNCTRLVRHVKRPFFMSLAEFRRAVEVLAPFAFQPPDAQGRKRVIGMMGGEPLLHPQFPELVDIFCEVVPDITHRGLWTGVDWPNHRHAASVRKLLGDTPSMDLTPRRSAGFINWNQHGDAPGEHPSYHQSPLVAVRDVIPDPAEQRRLIDQCWMQENWSSCITPHGFFFCEIAAAFDTAYSPRVAADDAACSPDKSGSAPKRGPRVEQAVFPAAGRGVTPDCWRHDLEAYTDQLERYCYRCGFCLFDQARGEVVVPGLPHRLDADGVDDVTRSNLQDLEQLGSPRILAGEFQLYEPPGEAAGGNTACRRVAGDDAACSRAKPVSAPKHERAEPWKYRTPRP